MWCTQAYEFFQALLKYHLEIQVQVLGRSSDQDKVVGSDIHESFWSESSIGHLKL